MSNVESGMSNKPSGSLTGFAIAGLLLAAILGSYAAGYFALSSSGAATPLGVFRVYENRWLCDFFTPGTYVESFLRRTEVVPAYREK
jgi:hypothetical protein